MLEITLDLESLDAVALSEAHSCRFDGLGGTIGRDEANTLVLQDKHRRVSRLHASVTFPADTPTITNVSTSLPIHVDGQLLGYGEKMPLLHGQHLEIGPYVLKVRTNAATKDIESMDQIGLPDVDFQVDAPFDKGMSDLSPLVTPTSLPVRPANIPTPAAVGDPFDELLAGIGPASADPFGVLNKHAVPDVEQPTFQSKQQMLMDDPFAGLIDVSVTDAVSDAGATDLGTGVELAKPPLQLDTLLATTNETWLPARSALNVIPEDFNPFDLPSETGRNSADPLAQMLGGESCQAPSANVAAEPSIDVLFSSTGGSSFEIQSVHNGSSSNVGREPDVFAGAPVDSDPLLMFGLEATDANDSMRQPMRNDLPEISGAFLPPRSLVAANLDVKYAQPNDAMAGLGRHVQTGIGQNFGYDALTESFLKGAGLSPTTLPGGLTPEVMAVIGSLLRTATAGAVDMLAARAATKMEVQASVTIISSQSNNPLKFSPNAEVAMQQMLGKKMPGFMRADEAMRDAFDDLRAHEIGVIAGTRAALTEVLGRFDPSVLGNRLTSGSLLENLLPALRMKKLWEIYLEQYAKIRQEAEDDFQSIFGRSFLLAYERETARVKAKSTVFGNNQ